MTLSEKDIKEEIEIISGVAPIMAYVGAVMLGGAIFYLYQDEHVFLKPILGWSKRTWSIIMLAYGGLLALLTMLFVPSMLRWISGNLDRLDRETSVNLAWGLGATLFGSVCTTTMLVTSFVNLGFDDFARARPVDFYDVLALSVDMLLNGLFLDIFEHFNWKIINLEPQSYFGPIWITLFVYRLFYGFNSFAIVRLAMRLVFARNGTAAKAAGT